MWSSAGPPAPVYRSLVGTLLVVYPLAVGISLFAAAAIEVEIPVASPQSIIWRVGFVFALLWVELHRQSTRIFLVNMGVSRRRTLGSLLVVYAVLDGALVLAAALASRA